MFVDCEFKLKDDSKGIPSHILEPLVEVYCLLRKYGFVRYYISYSGGGSFHFGSSSVILPLDRDLRDLLEMDVLGPTNWEAFLWLKENTIYTGSSENDEGSIEHPDDFFEYVEGIIKSYKRRGSLCTLTASSD